MTRVQIPAANATLVASAVRVQAPASAFLARAAARMQVPAAAGAAMRAAGATLVLLLPAPWAARQLAVAPAANATANEATVCEPRHGDRAQARGKAAQVHQRQGACNESSSSAGA